MKELPILFNGAMVRAILEGRKTQTRRILKPQPLNIVSFTGVDNMPTGEFGACMSHHGVISQHIRCPYGQPGDRLWVRETFGYEIRSVGGTPHEQIAYRASKPDAVRCYDCNGMEKPMKWRPSIHMPRWASRITLEVTDVRVERLQDISEEDAKAEGLRWHGLYKEWGGVESHPDSRPDLPQWRWYEKPVEAFKNLWDAMNGAGSWDANPWVWVVEFRRVIQ